MKKVNKKERNRIITAMVIASSIVLAMNPETIFAMEENSDGANLDNNITLSDVKTPEDLKQSNEPGSDTSKDVSVNSETKANEGLDSHNKLEEQTDQKDESASGEKNTGQDEDKQKVSVLKAEAKSNDQIKDKVKTNSDENLEEKSDENTDKSENYDTKDQISVLGENKNSTANDDETDLDVSNPIKNDPLKSSNPVEEKNITLYQNGVGIGGFDTLQEAMDKMYELTNYTYEYDFIIEVNKDIELREYSQFGAPYGTVLLRSKDSSNPRTIKANVQNNDIMLGAVNGTKLILENIIIDGNHQKRLFWVEGPDDRPSSLTINDGAILQNGKVNEDDNTKHGAAIFSQKASSITINGGIIRNNESPDTGGAITYIGKGTLTINGGELSENKSDSGGAIYTQGNTIINGGKISNNQAVKGAGIYTAKESNLKILGGEISENVANGFGGGIYSTSSSKVEIAGGKIKNNESKQYGGGIYTAGNSIVKLTDGVISDNKADYGGAVSLGKNSKFIMDGTGIITNNSAKHGGGIYTFNNPSCELISGTIEKNSAPYGGGLFIRSSTSKIGGVLIQENFAKFGGGIYSNLPNGTSLTIDGVKLYKNEATSGGGVCLTNGSGVLNFRNAEFKENKAYYGGGIWTSNSMKIENSSFEGNEAIKLETPQLPNGEPENMGHGGAIYVNTRLADDGEVTIDSSIFKNNKADKSGGAISVDETHGLLKVINNTVFDGNEATGKLGHGGAIYSNLHAYMPEYDDGSHGGLVQPPTAKDYYFNINTDNTTVFKNNKAFRTFTPPSTKDEFEKILYKSTSHPGTKYDHPLNNDDINLIIFRKVTFHKNYQTDDPTFDSVFDSYLLMEGSKLDGDFPKGHPDREGYIFESWNTQADGKGTKFTADDIIDRDIDVYAIYDKKAEMINEAPQLEVKDKTINKGDYLNLIDLVVSATDKEDGDLRDKVSLIDTGGFNSNEVGEYSVSFKVTDSKGASIVKKAKVNVVENPKPDQPDKPTEPDKPIEPDNPIKPNEPDLPIIPIEPSPIDDDTIRVVDEPEDKPIDDEKTPKQDNDEEVDKPSKAEKKDEPVLIDPIKKKQSANPKTGVAPGMSLTSIISSILGSTFGLHILKKKKD